VLSVNGSRVRLQQTHLFNGTLQFLCHGLCVTKLTTMPEMQTKKALTESHLSGDLNDLIQRDALRVLDVLLLLAVSWRLFEGLDDERRR